MKSIKKLSLASFALMLFFSAFAVSETNAQANAINEILKRIEAHTQNLTSLKTGVKMVKVNTQLDESETTEGSATYLPPEKEGKDKRDSLIRIDWAKPRKETLSVVNKKYVLYIPDLKQAYTGNASQAKGNGKANNLFSFLNMSKDELKANYDIKYLGEEKVSGTPTWHLQLTPKKDSPFTVADIWVDGNGMPIQVKATEKNKDTTTIILSGMQKNTTIKTSIFDVKIPKGTKIIEG